MRAISLDHHTPPELLESLRHLAEAVGTLGPALAGIDREGDGEAASSATRAAEAARRSATSANVALEETGNLSALHLIGQVRSTAVDLQRALGIPRAEAVESVQDGEIGAGPG